MVRPATMVGRANGRSIAVFTMPFPQKVSRTSTHAMSVPVTALIAATTSETASVSSSAATPSGAEIASQNEPSPPLPELQTSAASGSRTIKLRYAVTRPKPSARPDGARSTGSGRVAALASATSDLLLDLGHDPGLRIEELLLHLGPAAEIVDVEEPGTSRVLELGGHALHDRPVPRLREERLGLVDVVQPLALLPREDGLVLVGDQDVTLASEERVQGVAGALVLDRHVLEQLEQVRPGLSRGLAGLQLRPVRGHDVPASSATREGVRRDHGNSALDQLIPGPDLLGVALANDEGDDGLADDALVLPSVPALRDDAGLDELGHVRLERQLDDVCGQAVDHCSGLIARGAVRLGEGNALSGSSRLEGGDDLLVRLLRRRVGDERHLRARRGRHGRKRGTREGEQQEPEQNGTTHVIPLTSLEKWRLVLLMHGISICQTRTARGARARDLRDRQHALDGGARPGRDLGLDRDDVLPVAQRVAQLLERDHLHVLADRPLRDGLEPLARGLLAQPVQDPGLSGDEEALLGRGLGEAHHPLGRENVRAVVAEGHALARAPALGMHEQLGVRRLGLPALDVLRADPCVHVALAQPDRELAAGDPLQPDAEEHVGQEEDLAVLGDGLDHRLRVAGRAAVVRLGLHLRGRVHVRDDDGARVLGLPLAQLLPGDRCGEGAAGVRVRNQDRLVGREDRGCLGHEVDPAEDDCRRVGGRCLVREPQRVADVVGHVLHLGNLVVVGEDDRVALTRERPHLVLHPADRGRAHSTSRETSRALAEWVSAPMEAKSTPVSAISRTVSSVTPPEASSLVWPASETASRSIQGSMLSRRIRSAPASWASRTSSRLSASTSTGSVVSDERARSTAARMPPARRMWLSLIRTASYSPRRWFVPPPQRTAYFSRLRRPGVVLRVSRISTPVPETAST